MGAVFNGMLNQNSRRNGDAMCGGLDLYSYVEEKEKEKNSKFASEPPAKRIKPTRHQRTVVDIKELLSLDSKPQLSKNKFKSKFKSIKFTKHTI